MGQDITPGHTYIDGELVTHTNLNEHVSEGVIKETFISAKTLLDPVTLSTKIPCSDGAIKYTTLQQLHDLILYPGCIVQTVYGEYTANTDISAVIPADDTIPQNTEGTEIISASITPRFDDSSILVRAQSFGSMSIAQQYIMAVFRGAGANAIVSGFSGGIYAAGALAAAVLEYYDSPATTSSVTYSLRVGPQTAASLRLNGTHLDRYLGGSSRATLVLQEIKA